MKKILVEDAECRDVGTSPQPLLEDSLYQLDSIMNIP